MAQYMLLLHQLPVTNAQLPPETMTDVVRRYYEWAQAMREKGKLVGGEKLAAGRRMLDALAAQSADHQLRDLQGTVVRVTGVGFFDVRHFQVGRARSCIELHPILAIERITR